MDCCKPEETSSKNAGLCPLCEKKGSAVKLETLRSLIAEESANKIDENLNYRYCKNSDCEVTYYSDSSNQYFKTDDLKVKATHKDQGFDVNVCYCFGYTRQKVLDEIRDTGKSTVVESIKAQMKDPGCHCETRNPQGACCLGNVTAWVKEAKALKSK